MSLSDLGFNLVWEGFYHQSWVSEFFLPAAATKGYSPLPSRIFFSLFEGGYCWVRYSGSPANCPCLLSPFALILMFCSFSSSSQLPKQALVLSFRSWIFRGDVWNLPCVGPHCPTYYSCPHLLHPYGFLGRFSYILGLWNRLTIMWSLQNSLTYILPQCRLEKI